MKPLVLVLLCASLFFSGRSSLRLLMDWRRMRNAVRFVRESYARLDELPDEGALERDARAPLFLHLVPAYQEPEIASTLRALLASRYPPSRLRLVVITKEEEERAPHPAMGVSTGELVSRLRESLPPRLRERLCTLVMAGPGRKAHQLNRALRPEALHEILGADVDPARVFVGVSDADSVPDPDTFRWIAHQELRGPGALAYQGVTLSLANYERLDSRGKISAIQQASVHLRMSVPCLLHELKRARFVARLCQRFPRETWFLRPLFELFLRRSHICFGHNQFVRLDTLHELGGFPTSGATEDSTLGYALGLRRVLVRAMPMVELTELPETSEKVIQQNARWYKGVLDDVAYLWRAWRDDTSAYNLAQFVRHTAHKGIEWPIAACLYPGMGLICAQMWRFSLNQPALLALSLTVPTLALFLGIWVGGVRTHAFIEELQPYLPRAVDLRRKGWREHFLTTFRSHGYWLLATRGAWRVLGSLLRTGRFEPRKTDRLSRLLASPALQGSMADSFGNGNGPGGSFGSHRSGEQACTSQVAPSGEGTLGGMSSAMLEGERVQSSREEARW